MRNVTYEDDQIITIMVPNPKKVGSLAYDRFSKYRTGMTIAEARRAGITREDFRFDADHRYINID